MAILNIVKEGDPILRKVSREVTEITPRILTLIDDMIDTMREVGGKMDVSLRETGLGGVAATPFGPEIARKMSGE